MIEKLLIAPSAPGVYLFKDSKKNILYVGKAKNLKNRLRSYFQKTAGLQDARKSAMVKNIKDFSYIVTNNELEALVLEANLIKQYKPKFNVVLRDDKNYPYLKLTVNEEWPRLEVVRKIKKDRALYFGPYVPAGSMWEAVSFIRKNFFLRTCKYSLDKPMRPCVQFQLKRCTAPCAGLVKKKEYAEMVEDVKRFLQGKKKELLSELNKKMEKYSEDMRFEDAAKIRDSINNIKHIWETQKVVAPELGDSDVIGLYRQGKEAAFQIFFIRNGIMTGTKDFFLKDTEGISDEALTHDFIEQIYSLEIIPPDEIIISAMPEDASVLIRWLSDRRNHSRTHKAKTVKIISPQRGKRRNLLAMAEENAAIAFRNKKHVLADDALETIKQRLGLSILPASIGCLDVSTISGSGSVGAFVYWSEDKFQKNMYRHFRIQTVKGMDDYAMMRETAERLIQNLGDKLPCLMIIDGGKGQLETARTAFEKAGITNTEIISIAKDPDRVFTVSSAKPVDLEDRTQSSLLLKRIRDEAHRFAITFHRKLRAQKFMKSQLEDIRDIGPKRRLALLRRFGSIEDIRNAGIDDIAAITGFNKKIAESVIQGLRRKQ